MKIPMTSFHSKILTSNRHDQVLKMLKEIINQIDGDLSTTMIDEIS